MPNPNQLRNRAYVGGGGNRVFTDERGRQYLSYFYAYSVSITGIASGATGSASFTVQADADFVAMQLTGQVFDDTTTAVVTNPNTTVQINNTASGANFFNASQIWDNIVGTSQLPFILPVPFVILKSAQISFTVSNVASTNNQSYYVTMIGAKLLPMNEQDS